MALIPEEDIQKVIEASDLVQIASEVCPDLKQRGGKFLACCPFHKEKTPSFQIDPNLQLWHCFGCGEGGNIVTFVEKQYDMNFVETIEFLADKAGIQLHKVAGKQQYSRSQKGKLTEACNLAAEFYHNQLMRVKSAGANNARRYLGGRNFGSEISKRWTLGYAPGKDELTKFLLAKKFSVKDIIDANLAMKGKDGRAHDRFYDRVMFPIRDVHGNVIAFGGRIMGDGQPKYLNTNENPIFHKSQVLYGLDKAKANMASTGIAVVVEGYTDVIALHEAGINYAVATLGTALTKQHIRILNQHAKKKIVYLFDGDEAGQRAAERALNFIDEMERPEVYSKRAELVALTLPDNMDPAEFIAAKGKDELIKLINNAKPLLDYGIERKISGYDLSVPGNRARAASAALKVLAPIKDSLIAKEYASTIAEKTSMRTEDLLSELSKLKVNRDLSFDQNEVKKQVSTKTEKLETELLCVFAKHPQDTFDYFNNLDFNFATEENQELFNKIKNEIKAQLQIKPQELIYKVHENKLTTMSNMLDLKSDPIKHAQYVVYSLQIDQLKDEIRNIKSNQSSNDDKVFEQLLNMQNKLNELKEMKNQVL